MGHHDAAFRQLRRDARQFPGDVFVAEPVKAVTPHTFVIHCPRQRERIVHPGMAAMKGGVEAGNLRHPREGRHRRADPGQIVRLVQRRKRGEALEFGQTCFVQ